VTECPYCGHRVRRRAPKLDREPQAEPKTRRRLNAPALSKLRPGEIPGLAVETRPYGVIALICLSLVTTVVVSTGVVSVVDIGAISVPGHPQWWRWFAAPFLHDSIGYQFVSLIATAVFGTAIERRFGRVAVVGVFVLCGVAGVGLSVATAMPGVFGQSPNFVMGANGAALGLACFWLVDDRLAFRRGDDRGNDLIGAWVFCAILLAISLAVVSANLAAALGGAVCGSVLGFGMSSIFKR
jgi:membrane associated rhomboid family serine protease